MSGIYLTKIAARAEQSSVEGLARMIAFGVDDETLDGYEIGIESASREPAFEHLADTGLFVVTGIIRARVVLSFDYAEGRTPSIDGTHIVSTGKLTLNTPSGSMIDTSAKVAIAQGNAGKKASYYVLSTTGSFKKLKLFTIS